jgi:simple sugar transport system substrate-binding protein
VIQTVEVPVEAEGWCSGVTIRFFAGGAEGDAFASIVYRGARQAEIDLGPTVDYVWSGWNTETMLAQLRDAIAAGPDGIAFMGHAGDDAVLPLAAEAADAGILMMYQNVDVPQVRATYSGGYVGAILEPQGRALGQEALRTLDLEPGDRAIVLGPYGQPGRFIREEAVAAALEDGGLIVERITTPPDAGSNPELMLPDLTAAFLAHPETRLIVYSGGQLLGQAPMFMEALGVEPGEVYNIGFDTSPAVMTAFEQGYVQITSDQQPFLQGYMPILNLCLSKVYGIAPLFIDSGAGFVDTTNWQTVRDLADAGIR